MPAVALPKALRGPRLVALALILVLAPVFAEYSSAYLSSTGDPLAMAGEMIVLIPLYGCPALLIREFAVRRGRGWPGILLLAAAFGLLQAGLTDRSIFTLTGTDEAYWRDIVDPTWVSALGVSLGPTVGWVLGHVITSFGAPLAVADGLVPDARGRRLLGVPGLVAVAALFALAAVAVHVEIATTYRPVPSALQYAVVTAGVLALAALAFSPVGRPRAAHTSGRTHGRRGALLLPLGIGGAALFVVDLAGVSWVLLLLCCAVAIAAAAVLVRLARSSGWLPASAGVTALGALLVRAVAAFQTPRADGVTTAEKAAHNVGFLLLILVLLAAVTAGAGRQVRATATTTRSPSSLP